MGPQLSLCEIGEGKYLSGLVHTWTETQFFRGVGDVMVSFVLVTCTHNGDGSSFELKALSHAASK